MNRILALLCLAAPMSASAVPLNLTNQGYLADSTGAGLDGTYDLTFSLYDDAAATNPAVWAETLSVQITDGTYAVVLGNSTDLDEATLDQYPLYLGLSVDGATEMTPRHELTSVPYAILAETAFNVSGGTVDATDITSDTLTIGTTVIDANGVTVDGTVVIDDSGNVSGGSGGTDLPLGCTDGQLARWDDNNGNWACSNESFSLSVASGITAVNVSNWDDAYSWGDHGAAGYVTTESDPQFTSWESNAAHGPQEWDVAYDNYLNRNAADTFTGALTSGVSGSTAAVAIDLANDTIAGVNQLRIHDYGPSEGMVWPTSSNDWSIDVAPENRSNADGDLWLYGTSGSVRTNRRFIITDATDIDIGTNAVGGLTIGPDSGTNLQFDTNEIQGMNNGGPSSIWLNSEGGATVGIGSANTGTRTALRLDTDPTFRSASGVPVNASEFALSGGSCAKGDMFIADTVFGTALCVCLASNDPTCFN